RAARQPAERGPEQQTLHLGERQPAFDPTAGFGVEEMSLVPELPLDYGLPSGPVEEGCLAAARDELVPAVNVVRLQRSYLHGIGRGSSGGSTTRQGFKRELAHAFPRGTGGQPAPTENP